MCSSYAEFSCGEFVHDLFIALALRPLTRKPLESRIWQQKWSVCLLFGAPSDQRRCRWRILDAQVTSSREGSRWVSRRARPGHVAALASPPSMGSNFRRVPACGPEHPDAPQWLIIKATALPPRFHLSRWHLYDMRTIDRQRGTGPSREAVRQHDSGRLWSLSSRFTATPRKFPRTDTRRRALAELSAQAILVLSGTRHGHLAGKASLWAPCVTGPRLAADQESHLPGFLSAHCRCLSWSSGLVHSPYKVL